MRKCPNGHDVSDDVKYCPKCGAEIQENVAEDIRFCKKCGQERKGAEKFCSHCGTPFYGDPVINPDSSNAIGEIAHGSSSNKILMLLLIIVPIILIGGYFVNNHIQEEKRLEKARIEENERAAEEERKRMAEDERRKGVEKIVTLSFTREEQNSNRNLIYSGSYGAIILNRKFQLHVATDYIPIPKGKVWIYEKMRITKGDPAEVSLWYYSRESGAIGNRLGSLDSEYILKEGGLPVLRPGDGFRISFIPFENAGTKSIEVIFREKDEDLYF